MLVFLGFRKFGPNIETLKLAKISLAKVGQHLETLKLASVCPGGPEAARNFAPPRHSGPDPEPQRPSLVGPPGFHTTAREPNVHISGFWPSETPPKFNEQRHPERDTETAQIVAGRGREKERNGGPPPFGSSTLRKKPFAAPPFGAPPLGAPPFGAPPFGAHPSGHHP